MQALEVWHHTGSCKHRVQLGLQPVCIPNGQVPQRCHLWQPLLRKGLRTTAWCISGVCSRVATLTCYKHAQAQAALECARLLITSQFPRDISLDFTMKDAQLTSNQPSIAPSPFHPKSITILVTLAGNAISVSSTTALICMQLPHTSLLQMIRTRSVIMCMSAVLLSLSLSVSADADDSHARLASMLQVGHLQGMQVWERGKRMLQREAEVAHTQLPQRCQG